MAHYIDKDALVAEIEKLIQQHSSKEYIDEAGCVLDELEDFLDALEVKDVDLEKELKEYIDDEWSDEWSGDVGNWIRWRRGTSSMTVEDVKDIAKHFFELGMKAGNKAQKGE